MYTEHTKEPRTKLRGMLYGEFEKNIAVYEQKLAKMLLSVPADGPEIAAYMGKVAILVCYIKRQFNLLISEINGNETITFGEFGAYINELAEIARFIGPKFILCCNLTGGIDTRRATLFYEFFNSVTEWAIENKIAESVVNIVSENGGTGMNLMLPSEALGYAPPEKITVKISAARGSFAKDDQGDITVLRLFLPETAAGRGPEPEQADLRDFVANIGGLGRSEELLRIKSEAHDAQNKKLSIILRYLRHKEYPDLETFFTLGESLSESIKKTEEIRENPLTELGVLVDIYKQIGVSVQLTGDLPQDGETASVMFYVLREAAANAVIHGHADKIYAWIMYSEQKCSMRITDNSSQAVIKFTEGGGIAEMRRKLKKLGGKLYIKTSPRFTLIAVAPEI